jgi:hypothetical protein
MIAGSLVAGNEDPATCWNRLVHDDVVERLKSNYDTLRTIGQVLFEKERVGGPRLQKLLATVQINP